MSDNKKGFGKITSDAKLSGSVAPILMNEGYPGGTTRNDLLAKISNAKNNTQYHVEKFPDYIEAADFGNKFEDQIIAEAAKRLAIEKWDDAVSTVYDYDDLFSVSLDAIFFNKKMRVDATDNIKIMSGADSVILQGDGVCEAKLTGAPYSDVPPAYRGVWQLEMQMMCKGASWGVLAILNQGTRLTLYIYQADPVRQKMLIDAARDFYRRLENMEWYPALDSNDAARVFPMSDAQPSLDLEPFADLAIQYFDARRAAKRCEALAKAIEPRLMEAMGNHEFAHLNFEDGETMFEVKWPTRSTKAQPEKIVPAKPAKVERQKSLTIPAKWLGDSE